MAFRAVSATKFNPIYPAASMKGGMHMIRLTGCQYMPLPGQGAYASTCKPKEFGEAKTDR